MLSLIIVRIVKAGVAQLVELQPSKLDVASSSLVSRSNLKRRPKRYLTKIQTIPYNYAHVAQSVERFLGKEEVHRFNPGRGLHLFQVAKIHDTSDQITFDNVQVS